MTQAPCRPMTLALVLAAALTGCAADPVKTVESFSAARDSGDLEAARAHLADDPRVWYESREGEGHEWTLGAGRWSAWDDHFNSVSIPGPWRIEGDSVWRINEEWNDYYDLIERTSRSRYRITYFLEGARGARRIKGYMISAADPRAAQSEPRADRFDEIDAWARATEPDEWEYLRPGGRLDPTGDRAPRTRALINRWRESVGLAPVD